MDKGGEVMRGYATLIWATMLAHIALLALITSMFLFSGSITYKEPYENVLWFCLAAFLLSGVYAVILMLINAYRAGNEGK